MPRDSSGIYTLPTGNPVIEGTIIEAEWANPTMADIAAQLNNVLTKDGVVQPSQPLRFTDGSAAAPSITFAADTDTGFFRKTIDTIGFTAGGVERLSFSTSSVNFTTSVTGITAPPLDNTTKLATTEYVRTAVSTFAAYPVGGGSDKIFLENDMAVTTNYTLSANKNAGTFGPVTINNGISVIVPTGAVWSIV